MACVGVTFLARFAILTLAGPPLSWQYAGSMIA
jgi:hypothetical protein